MSKEKVMEMENVEVKETKEDTIMENKVRRFCTNCGKEIWVDASSRVTLCDDCREAKKKAQAEHAKALQAKRKAELGLVTMNVVLHESTRDKLKEMAKARNVSVAEFLKELVAKAEQETEQENA